VCDALYVHVPFCRHRCHYCDFFTIAGRDDARSAYVDALLKEAAATLPGLPMEAPTIFVGGGTPTYLPAEDLDRLLSGVGSLMPAAPIEWTVEANPETVDAAIAGVLVDAGVTRVSLGMQSAQPQLLKALERQHDPDSVPRAVSHLRDAGMQALSLDLIFGIPGQTLDQVSADLDAALALHPVHLSVYGLVYEPGTPLRSRRDRGLVLQVDNAVEADMYRCVQERLKAAGFEQYEISNWSLPGQRCRHNEHYWTNGNWWPLGPAAAGHIRGLRWRNAPRLANWIASEGVSPVVDIERVDIDGQLGETLMLGLRLMDGVPRMVVEAACATPKRGHKRAEAIERHLGNGLIAWRNDALALTHEGLLLGDLVIGDVL
jgi:oxygen-independent coproporphyrinogen-3 oxidase